MKNPLLSIIIPTYNEEKDIVMCIASLKNQSYKNFEIILVDDGSTDNTLRVIKKFKDIKTARQNHLGPGSARNLGSKLAKGKILIFVDADMTFQKDYLKNLISPILEDKKIIGTTHDYEIVKNIDNIWSRCWGKIRVSRESANQVKIFRAIRKEKFIELGGFDPRYGYADDQTFWFKYQKRPKVANNSTCYHRNPESLKSVFKQSSWIGASIEGKLTNIPIIKYLSPLIYILFSPIAIPFLTIKRSILQKELSIIHYMLIFITVRYFGTIKGISRRIYKNVNYR